MGCLATSEWNLQNIVIYMGLASGERPGLEMCRFGNNLQTTVVKIMQVEKLFQEKTMGGEICIKGMSRRRSPGIDKEVCG